MRWTYGVTTVPSRLTTTLPLTLNSLKEAGFPKPRLFIDGAQNDNDYKHFGLETTCRYPVIKTAPNWLLSLLELYLREANAELFALFQDDIMLCKNVCEYLDQYAYGKHVKSIYWNLYSVPMNETKLPEAFLHGFHPAPEMGKGALALVFDREAVVKLFANDYTMRRPQSIATAWESIDGGIVTAMRNIGYQEMVHYPSLVYHIGKVSTMNHPEYKGSTSFPGESFDARELRCSEIKSQQPLKELVSLVNL